MKNKNENRKRKSKSRNRIKNVVLKSISVLAFCLFILGGISLDSFSNIPYIMCIISLLWLVPFGIANRIIQL